MTANQIAQQQVYVNKEIAENQLAETNRHNEKMESIEESKLEYQNAALRVSADWNEWQKRWAEEYTAKWREIEYAQEERKIEIQDDLRRLEWEKQATDAKYKSDIAYNQSVANELEAEKNRLTQEWNKHRESVDWATLGLSEKELFLKNKQIEYENSLKHEQNLINQEANYLNYNQALMQNTYQYASLNFAREQMNRNLSNQYNIAVLNAGIRQQELAFQQEKFTRMELPNSRFQNFQYLMSGLTGRSGAIPTVLEAVPTVIGAFYGPKAQFNKLFK